MDSKKSKTSDPHRLLLNLSDMLDFKKVCSCQFLAFTIYGKNT